MPQRGVWQAFADTRILYLMQLRLIHSARLCLVFAVLIALAASGFAHRFAASQPDDNLTAYLAAGGSYADLCGEADPHDAATCDACRLVDTVTPAPANGGRPLATLAQQAGFVVAAAALLTHHPFDPACPVRAPPVV